MDPSPHPRGPMANSQKWGEDRTCCRPAVVPAVVSAGVVLESAAVARPRRPGCCQPESGVTTPEGSADGPIE